MVKQGINIDPHTVGRYALGGAITGGAAAAAMNLMRMVNQMREDRKRKLQPTETDEGTIVLTLPNKAGEVAGKCSEPVKVTKKENPKSTTTTTIASKSKQLRRSDGTFGQKTAAGWPTLTASGLAAIGGGAVGAHVVNKIYEKRREQQLKTELAAAQQEYMDLLQGGQKGAEWVERMIPDVSPMGKEGQSRMFGYLDYPLAFGAMLSILGSGGAAYLTKRILDEKMRDADTRSLDIPQVKRVVFRSAPAVGQTPEEKESAAIDMECVQASLGVMLDKVGTHTLVLIDPEVKQAMIEVGTTAGGLMKMANELDTLMSYLESAPKLRQMIQRAAMAKHPVLGKMPGFMRNFAMKMPFVQQKADNMLYDKVRGSLSGPGQQAAPALPAPKTAGIMSSLIGSTLAEPGTDNTALAQAIVAEQEKARVAREGGGQNSMRRVEVNAQGQQATQFLEKNKKQILGVIRRMMNERQM